MFASSLLLFIATVHKIAKSISIVITITNSIIENAFFVVFFGLILKRLILKNYCSIYIYVKIARGGRGMSENEFGEWQRIGENGD
ncbi:MAG: hypothetical protein LBQ24_00205 [Candidatus Peribacteria bacterium]|nr:hypothetical protein [Candidatus Peribacteria bacterium]